MKRNSVIKNDSDSTLKALFGVEALHHLLYKHANLLTACGLWPPGSVNLRASLVHLIPHRQCQKTLYTERLALSNSILFLLYRAEGFCFIRMARGVGRKRHENHHLLLVAGVGHVDAQALHWMT